jgi:hypothetical protein
MSTTELIIITSHLPIVVSALYAGLLYKKLDPILRLFSLFLFFSAVIQITALILAINRTNNLPLLHVYVAVGFLLLSLFYKRVLNNFIHAGIIWLITGCFLIYTILNSIFIETFFTFNSIALAVESVLIIILSLSTYMVLMNDIVKEQRSPIIKSLNWINSGLFIYYTSSLIIFYLTRNFPKSINNYTWILHSFFSIIMYVCFIIGLYKRTHK